jgi:DNA-binding CsgD family transcriptional regulator
LTLTPREHQAGGLMLLGFTLKESAQELGIKPRTISFYLKRFYHKHGIDGIRRIKAATARRLFEQDRLAGCGPEQISGNFPDKNSESPARR